MTTLGRKATAEALGTAFLVAAVVGSGIAAQRLSPNDAGLQLLQNSIATGGALMALILAFGAVSGAHFNPVVTLASLAFGSVTPREAAAYIPAQIGGAMVGAVAANVMFDLDPITLSTDIRAGSGIWLAEVIATLGLLLVVLGVVRSGQSDTAPYAVAGYITAAYWFTSSTSFANPAVTLARALTQSFAGIRPEDVSAFLVAQMIGAILAWVTAFAFVGSRQVPKQEI